MKLFWDYISVMLKNLHHTQVQMAKASRQYKYMSAQDVAVILFNLEILTNP